MGTTIQPLNAEEVEHRAILAGLFQNSTLARLKTAAELYADDLDSGAKDGDPASAAQCLLELARRGEWSENALGSAKLRKMCDHVADATDEDLARLKATLPAAGYATVHVGWQVHLVRAELWLRMSEARVMMERQAVSA